MFIKGNILRQIIVVDILIVFLIITGCKVPTKTPDNIVHQFMKEGNVQGVFVAVVKGDSVLYQKSFGVADKENGIPMTNTTCMELGSISKAFTGKAIYLLNSRKLLN